MHHLTLADKSLLIGDEAADLLLTYGAVVAQRAGGDHIAIKAFDIDGEETVAHILLSAGTTMVAESTQSLLPEPDNSALIGYIRERLAFFGLTPPDGTPGGPARID